jgi:threonine synthase
MWRYGSWLPLAEGERPITLGEGGTPLLTAKRIGERHGFEQLLVKDEANNPTGSFKARGLAIAVTRATLAGAKEFVIPTAGNAGIALAAYATRAGARARVYAPSSTPRRILEQIKGFGGDLMLLEGHIGDCGIAARLHADNTGALDVSTLREPYRIEGKKTLGLELAEQLGWTFPDVIIYPTGGGTGLIGMWKAFRELRDSGWVRSALPRMFTVQASGCAPVVQAFETGAERSTPWENPTTVAAGLRVPSPLGDRLMLRALRESGGGAIAVSDEALQVAATELQAGEGIDASPEGGAALAGAIELKRRGVLTGAERVVVFNTGAGWLYRS